MFDEEDEYTNPGAENDEADITVYGSDEGDEVDFDLDGDSQLQDVDDMEEPDFEEDEFDGEEDDELAADDAAGLVSQIQDLLDQLVDAVDGGEGDEDTLELDGEDDELPIEGEDEGGADDDLMSDEGDEYDADEEDDEYAPVKEATDQSSLNGTMQKIKVPSEMDDKQVEPKSSAKKANKLPKHSVDSGISKFTSTEDSVSSVKKGGNATSKLTPPQANAIMDLVKKYMSQTVKNIDDGAAYKGSKLTAMEALDFDMSSDIARLATIDESISPEVLTKLGVIFESAVNTKVDAIASDIELQFSLQVTEATKRLDEKYAANIDEYMGYVVENYFDENRIAIREGVKTELSESFIAGIRDVFEAHYVEVPEGKVNIVEQAEQKAAEIEAKLQRSTKQAIALRKENAQLKRNAVIMEAAADLSMNEATKLRRMAEGVEFKDSKQFSEALESLKEYHFKGVAPKSPQVETAEPVLTESTERNSIEGFDFDAIDAALKFDQY